MAGAGSRCISIIDRNRIIFSSMKTIYALASAMSPAKEFPRRYLWRHQDLVQGLRRQRQHAGEIVGRLNIETCRDNQRHVDKNLLSIRKKKQKS